MVLDPARVGSRLDTSGSRPTPRGQSRRPRSWEPCHWGSSRDTRASETRLFEGPEPRASTGYPARLQAGEPCVRSETLGNRIA
jgi:hypothetical protein